MKKICFAGILLFSCSTIVPAQQKKQGGNEAARASRQLMGAWTLQWMNGENLDRLYPGRKPNVNINPVLGKIAGFNGCNNYFGNIRVDNHALTLLGALATTKMACKDTDEGKYMSIIGRIKSFTVTDSNRLELITDKGVELKFTRMPKSAPHPKPSN